MNSDTYESKFHAILGRALTDHKFRAALIDRGNPDGQKEALREMGADDSDEALQVLNDSIDALTTFARHFSPPVEAA